MQDISQYVQQEITMTPEQVQQMKRADKMNLLGKILAIIFFIGVSIVMGQQFGIIPEILPFDTSLDNDLLLIILLPASAIVILIVAFTRGAAIDRDIAERVVQVIHTTLRRKKYDRDDDEYELHFEGIRGDVDVSKESYDMMMEGTVYELHLAKHTQRILMLRDIESGAEFILE